jgi:hypothetical protein
MRRHVVWALIILGVIALPVLAVSSPIFAATGTCGTACSVSASPAPPTFGAPNTAFAIKVSASPTAAQEAELGYVAVILPDGSVYSCDADDAGCSAPTYLGIGELVSCTIPYGAAGSLASTGDGLIQGCSGTNSQSWEPVSNKYTTSLSAMEAVCTEGGAAGLGGVATGTVGDTSQSGEYTVVVCWLGLASGNTGLYATASFVVCCGSFTTTATETVTTTTTSVSTSIEPTTTTLTGPTTTTTQTTTTTSVPPPSTTTVTTTSIPPPSTTTLTTIESSTTTTTTTTTTTYSTEGPTTTVTVTTTMPTTITSTNTVTTTQTNTATTTQTSTATSTQTTTATSTAQPPSLMVESVNQNNQPITGYWSILRMSGGGQVGTGYTPKTYTGLTPGATYTIELDSYGNCQFSHWSDGVTSDPRAFTASGALTLVGVYNCGSSAAPAVGHAGLEGSLSGLAIILSLIASSALAVTMVRRLR